MPPPTPSRLDGWKAIAEYLGRDPRTLQRWRDERGLPIYRVPGAKGGTVFAYPPELDAWLREAPLGRNGAMEAEETSPQVAEGDLPAPEPVAGTQGEAMAQPAPPTPRSRWPASARRLAAGAAILAALAVVAAARFTSSGPPAAPAPVEGAEVRGDTLVALDANERPVWTFKLPPPSGSASAVAAPSLTAAFPIDFESDGRRELIALVAATESAQELSDTYALSPTGTLLWRFTPDVALDFDGRRFERPWRLRQWLPPTPGAPLWMSFIHQVWWPSFVVSVDRTGRPALRFVNSGHIEGLGRLTTPRGAFVLAGGTNNEYGAASLAVLSEHGGPAMSPHDNGLWRVCEACPRDMPARYFLFPRSELNLLARTERNFAYAFTPYDDGSLDVSVRERAEPVLRIVYHLSPALEPEWAAMSDAYWVTHDYLFNAGALNHSAGQCPVRGSGMTVRTWDAERGWRDVLVPYGFQNTEKGG